MRKSNREQEHVALYEVMSRVKEKIYGDIGGQSNKKQIGVIKVVKSCVDIIAERFAVLIAH